MSTETSRQQIEIHLLSSLLKDSTDILKCMSLGLNNRHFTSAKRQAIFATMLVIAADPKTRGPMMMDAFMGITLKGGGSAPCTLAELAELDNKQPTSINALKFCEHLITIHKREEVAKLLTAATASADFHKHTTGWDEVWTDVSGHLAKINDVAADAPPKTLADACDEAIAELKDPLAIRRLPIGIPDWDRVAGSLRDNELVVLAARPGAGKTALAVQIASGVASRNESVAFFSLEMTAKEMAERLGVHRGGPSSAGDHPFAVAQRIAQIEKLKKVTNLHVFEVQQARNLSAIESRCHLLKQSKLGLAVVIIDYLQLIGIEPEMKKAPREQQVADLTRRLKLLANTIRVPIILLAQLNRDVEKEERAPRLSDLRESGAIEQDADRVLFLHKHVDEAVPIADDAANIEVVLTQAKCRNGVPGIGKILLFQRPCFRFSPISKTTA